MTNIFEPKVSIVIPVYNGSNFLNEAIDSALAQIYKNIEIIVVNDGSNDNGQTERIALSYGQQIKYYSKQNGGTSTALNLGIHHMTGDYFSWLSHDDLYLPNKIGRQIDELAKLANKDTIIMSDLRGINEKKQTIYKTDYLEHINEYPPREISNLYPIIYNKTHGCTLLIPKKCFEVVGLFDERQIVAQDFEFFYRAFQIFPHKLIPEILVIARESSNRQGRSKKDLCDVEYSDLYINMMESLTDDEIIHLAPNKLIFYEDMRRLFQKCQYTNALSYLNKKIIKNIQISSYDLVGNKFNGHDLHFYLRQKGIDSKQIVLFKESKDPSTIRFDFNKTNSTKEFLQNEYFLESDIVHLHLIHNIFDLNYLPMLCRLKPTVITLHDPFFLAAHCVHHFDCNKWKTHCYDCPYINELFPLPYDYSALNFGLRLFSIQNSNITAIVASKWLEKKVRQSPIWKGKKVYYLPFGINQQIFQPQNSTVMRKKLRLPLDSKILFFRAESDSFKGLDIIEKALSSLDKKENIVILTVGKKGLLREFEKQYKVFEYGWVHNDSQLAQLYQACDIFLMPSRQETFGMMAIEAMSCGKMVLAIKGKGTALPETINSNECGLAVDEENYSSELQRLLNNQNEILQRGEKSLIFAKSQYSKEKYIDGLLEIYKEVVAKFIKDDSSVLIVDQLKKHRLGTYLSKPANNFNPDKHPFLFGLIYEIKTFMMILFRKLPVRFQRSLEPLLFKFYNRIRKKY